MLTVKQLRDMLADYSDDMPVSVSIFDVHGNGIAAASPTSLMLDDTGPSDIVCIACELND